MSVSIWWIRRDLRLVDNQALNAALMSSSVVLPVFIQDDNLWASSCASEKRLDFLLGGLRQLDVDLKQYGSYLIYRHGKPIEILKTLISETGATAIFAEEDIRFIAILAFWHALRSPGNRHCPEEDSIRNG